MRCHDVPFRGFSPWVRPPTIDEMERDAATALWQSRLVSWCRSLDQAEIVVADSRMSPTLLEIVLYEVRALRAAALTDPWDDPDREWGGATSEDVVAESGLVIGVLSALAAARRQALEERRRALVADLMREAAKARGVL